MEQKVALRVAIASFANIFAHMRPIASNFCKRKTPVSPLTMRFRKT